jgi:hypothetical protein
MKYQVGQYLLSLTSTAYDFETGMYDLPVIYKIVEVLPYRIKVERTTHDKGTGEIPKSRIKDGYKLLSPVEMELYEN